jgi:hypothetical protein
MAFRFRIGFGDGLRSYPGLDSGRADLEGGRLRQEMVGDARGFLPLERTQP